MTITPEVIDLHPAAHPVPAFRQFGFPLDHPYVEQCWRPLIGPSSVSFLRQCIWHWQDGTPARVTTSDLAAELGLGRGTGTNSPLWRTIQRLDHFRPARLRVGQVAELEVFTRVPPVESYRLDRLPRCVRGRHDHHCGARLEAIARQAEDGPPPHVRMAERLDRMTHNPSAHKTRHSVDDRPADPSRDPGGRPARSRVRPAAVLLRHPDPRTDPCRFPCGKPADVPRLVAVRFTITPLGASGGRSVSAVVGNIVRYLQGPQPSPPTAGQSPPSTAGPSRYYADGSSEPGRWLGNAAAEAGLVWTVDDADFARVLAGRDPHTGARLISAQGSAGRCPTLGRGTQTRTGGDGAALYDLRDAAGALRITPAEAEDLVAAGEAYATALAAALLGGTEPLAPVAGSYLLPVIDTNGIRWVPETELARCEDARSVGTSADDVAAAGAPDDILSLADAARLAGVSVQYLRSVCRRSEQAQDASTATGQESKAIGPQLRSYRGTRRQWLVKRADLVEYLRRRTPPAVRVGYDLTLTT